MGMFSPYGDFDWPYAAKYEGPSGEIMWIKLTRTGTSSYLENKKNFYVKLHIQNNWKRLYEIDTSDGSEYHEWSKDPCLELEIDMLRSEVWELKKKKDLQEIEDKKKEEMMRLQEIEDSKPKIGVFLARMHPLHFGHQFVIDKMMKENDKVYVIIGSSKRSGEPRNPLPASLRRKILRAEYVNYKHPVILELPDLTDETDNSKEWGTYLEDFVLKQIREDYKWEESTTTGSGSRKWVDVDTGSCVGNGTRNGYYEYDSYYTHTETFYKTFKQIREEFKVNIYYSDEPEIINSWFKEDTIFNVKSIDRFAVQDGISATQIREMILNDDETYLKYTPKSVYDNIRDIQYWLKIAKQKTS